MCSDGQKKLLISQMDKRKSQQASLAVGKASCHVVTRTPWLKEAWS